jgi:hypothetical protein
MAHVLTHIKQLIKKQENTEDTINKEKGETKKADN